jgi:hypothetical protein
MDIDKFKNRKELQYKEKWIKNLIYKSNLSDIKIKNILEDALYYKHKSQIINKYINQAKTNTNSYRTVKQKQIINIITELEQYSEYKFLVIGGAMLTNKTIYEKSHKDAWENINNYIIDYHGGAILSAIAYELDGVSTNAIENIEKMFKQPDEKIRSALMSDFLKFKPIDPCSICRKKKMKNIIK